MKREINIDDELQNLCNMVRALLSVGEYRKCAEVVTNAMCKFPDAAQPHNLLGLLLEREGNHALAMRHFRAAWALDPTYRPARQNLEHYGTFYSSGSCAFDESDCQQEETFVEEDLDKTNNARDIEKSA